jgi:hypothetical protein
MSMLGGDVSGLSGLSQTFLSLTPNVFGGDSTSFSGGAPTMATMVTTVNLFYVFTTGGRTLEGEG